ncbi:aspartate/glutamate racemase family protein [Ornithinimicrobium cavernae]|uniref:maleate cis-trans isomerase family protein n=1 Tax=Ornithinimicrobium cavernae TaxID=2666047 RepID=UPI000D699BD8|nr:aspartate/glutamate racemase family protein [Ornithinimicrobium cavernae]
MSIVAGEPTAPIAAAPTPWAESPGAADQAATAPWAESPGAAAQAATGPLAGVPDVAPVGTVGVGVITPYDFALDRELWRWVPDSVTLHLTRTPYAPLPVSLEQATVVGDPAIVTRCTQDLITVRPAVVAYACTSGSFIQRRAGERALAASMVAAGAPRAVTTSGALVEALQHLGVSRVALATPYDELISQGLSAFVEEAGVRVTAMRHLGLEGRIWTVPYAVTVEIVRRCFTSDCDAVFISCTNLPTYDLIAPLEAELGVPVLTANQVTLWAALRAVGVRAVGPDQRLLSRSADQSPMTEPPFPQGPPATAPQGVAP